MPNNFNLIMILSLVISLLVASTVKADAPQLISPDPGILNPMEGNSFSFDNHDYENPPILDLTFPFYEQIIYESCSVTDPNNNVVDCSSIAGLTWDSFDGSINWNINYDQQGIWQFEIQAKCQPHSDYNQEAHQNNPATQPLTFDVNVQNFNQLPVLEDLANQTVDEESNWNYDIDDINDPTPGNGTDEDADGDLLTYSIDQAPTGFTINSVTGYMSWTPTSAQIGNHTIIISVDDGFGGSDIEEFDILVNDVNLAPVLAGALPPGYTTNVHSMDEWQNYTVDFQDYVTQTNDPDYDRDNEIISYECLIDYSTDGSNIDGSVANTFACDGFRPGMTFDNSSGVFTFNTDNFDYGDYEVKIIATDSSGSQLSDELIWELYIANVNFAPEIAQISNQSVNEGLTLDLLAEDIHPPQTYQDRDNEQLTFTCYYDTNIDGSVAQTNACSGFGATMNPTTGDFSYTPPPQATSPLEIRFIAEDPELAIDDTIFELTIMPVNLPPTLDPINPIAMDEGANHTLQLVSNDPNGDSLTIECEVYDNGSNIGNCEGILGATLDDNAQTILFEPDYEASGVYDIEVTVSDAEPLSAMESFELTVNHVNRAPEFDVALADITNAQEGQTYTVQPVFSDPDMGDTVTAPICTVDGVACDDPNAPLGITYSTSTGLFEWSLNYDQGSVSGINYTVAITIEDQDGLQDSDDFVVTVFHVNRPPVVNPTLADGSVDEGNFYTQSIVVTDPDGDTLSYSCSVMDSNSQNYGCGAYPNMSFSGGTVDFSPDFNQGPESLTITMTVNDGAASVNDDFVLTVNDLNQVPVLQFIADQDVDEGQTLYMDNNPLGFDPDGDPLTWTCDFGCSIPNLTFDATGNTAGNISFNPDYTQSGVYFFGISISDGQASASRTFSINVTHINQTPSIGSMIPETINENEVLNYDIPGYDPDSDPLVYTCIGNDCSTPEFSLDANTGTLTFTSNYDSAGMYNFTFRATDPDGAFGEESLMLIVSNVNRAPEFNPALANQSVDENVELSYTIVAIDPDNDNISYSSPNLPAGASIDSNTGVLSWTPDYDAAANSPYTVTIVAEDDYSPAANVSENIEITVNDINRDPVLAAIGAQSVDEDVVLQFTVTATDPDGNNLTFSASDLPTGASFDVNSQIFTWQPDYDQAGSYDVTFTVTDDGNPSLSDDEIVTITVNDINRAPNLAAIGNQNVDEGVLLSFSISATDPDGHNLTYSASGLPAGANFDSGTQSFTWTPSYTQAGTYQVTFNVDDDGSPSLGDSETIDIVVANINQAPVLASIGNQSVDENAALSFAISATDPDAGDTLSYSVTGLPSGASFDLNTLQFDWTPDYNQAGSYNVTFDVQDNGSPVLSASETITITVNNINRAPYLSSIGDHTVDENTALNFTLSGSDPDGDALTYSASGLPAGASFDNQTLQFSWTPDYNQGGQTYQVTFTLTDDGNPNMDDSETINISVNDINRSPELAAIGAQTVDEGQLLEFTISATDPDGDNLIYSVSNLPSGASFDVNTQVFSWTPDFNQTGNYSVTFEVSDDGSPSLSDSEVVTIDVGDVNRAPELAAIGNQSGDENSLVDFSISATDPDGDGLTYSATNLPSGATFSGSTFSWNTNYDDAGTYSITFTVTDDGNPNLSDTETISLIINDINRAPVLASIGAQAVDENQLLEFSASATDPDGHNISYSASDLPSGATFSAGTFSWTPGFDQAGSYDVTISATDDGSPVLSDSEVVTITVNNINQAPILAAIGDKNVDEGQSLSFNLSASDADGDSLTYSATNLPANANLSGNSFSFNPDHTQSGTFSVTFMVTDDGNPNLSDDETIIITVNEINQAPVLANIGPQSVNENELLEFTISGSDPDVADTISYSASNLPSGASFDPNTQIFSFTPDYNQSGSYDVTFQVSDDGSPSMSDSEIVSITVGDVNRAPVLAAIGNQTGDEDALLEFTISATDPDGDSLIYSASGLPSGAVFNVSNQTFSWTPGFDQAGTYSVTFNVDDNGTPMLSDSETISITIEEVNRAPVLSLIGAQSIDEGVLLSFNISATDPDGNNLSYSASGLPSGANFDSNSQSFTWTPGFDQAGTYNVTFNVDDDGSPVMSDSEVVVITVADINQAPILASIGSQSGDENSLVQFSISATDPDGDSLTYSAANLPTGATFSGNTFSWNTGYDDEGTYSISFTVTDDGNPNLNDSETIDLVIGNINQAPVLASIGSQSVVENDLLEFSISATDPDGDLITYSALSLPAGASFDPMTQTFSWIPGYDQEGSYSVTFQAADNGIPSLMDDEVVSISVSNTNRAPILAAIGSQTVNENESLEFNLSATDPDGNAISYSAQNMPAGATLVGNVFSFTPGYDQAGQYDVTFIASDDGSPSLDDQEIVSITVVDVNRAPILA
ncbi:putative Ig domain-containing protein, partial [Bacteriovoracaceae bacterium]|nr:putative Ig domain-containing protein [Bacteriovoracaceae bacterium]